MNDTCILKVNNLNKYFGTTHANKNISLSLNKGEIRGLAGENGSGKSTFVSAIAGINKKSSGEIYLDGKSYDPSNPIQASNEGVGIVVQELGLVGHLSLGVNMFLGNVDQFSSCRIINTKKMYKKAYDQMEKIGFSGIQLRSIAAMNSIEICKQVEIARALSKNPKILILDEVSQALSHNKRKLLYDIMRKCKEKGIAILLISHDLEELINLSDNITVLRDGEVVGTVSCEGLNPSTIKQMMIGREISESYYRTDTESNCSKEIVMEVKSLTTIGHEIEDVSFEVHKGEILAVCGLSDGGIHELGKAVFGLIKHKSGSVYIKSKNVQIHNAVQALANGMGYVPKDRDSDAMMLSTTIKENFALPLLMDIKGRFGYISEKRINKMTDDAVRDFMVKCTGITQIIGNLSGGNKQKVNLGRWITKGRDIFILDCPTRGVDVGVKAYIYDLLLEAKTKGSAILMISDELPEAIGMADRILVMSNGKLIDTIIRGDGFSEEEIIEVMV